MKARLEKSERAAKVEAKLLAKKKQIEARLRLLRAKQSHSERRVENRRHMLMGILVGEECERDAAFKASFYEKLERWLKRPIERELFGFPPLPEKR